jgi:hypothetical protein
MKQGDLVQYSYRDMPGDYRGRITLVKEDKIYVTDIKEKTEKGWKRVGILSARAHEVALKDITNIMIGRITYEPYQPNTA